MLQCRFHCCNNSPPLVKCTGRSGGHALGVKMLNPRCEGFKCVQEIALVCRNVLNLNTQGNGLRLNKINGRCKLTGIIIGIYIKFDKSF